MKKLTAIMREMNFAEKLFGLREKQVKTALAAARNNIEEQATQAEIEYENLCKKLGDSGECNYKAIINDMIRSKSTIRQAAVTAEILDAIEADLESDVQVEKKGK